MNLNFCRNFKIRYLQTAKLRIKNSNLCGFWCVNCRLPCRWRSSDTGRRSRAWCPDEFSHDGLGYSSARTLWDSEDICGAARCEWEYAPEKWNKSENKEQNCAAFHDRRQVRRFLDKVVIHGILTVREPPNRRRSYNTGEFVTRHPLSTYARAKPNPVLFHVCFQIRRIY